MMNKSYVVLGALGLLAGCASLSTGPVQQIGKDSYTLRVLSEKSISTAKQQALTQAGSFCKTQGNRNVMLVKEISGTEEGTGERYYDLTFLCLNADDSDFQRVNRADIAPSAGPDGQDGMILPPPAGASDASAGEDSVTGGDGQGTTISSPEPDAPASADDVTPADQPAPQGDTQIPTAQ
jgi:hypothetical protein